MKMTDSWLFASACFIFQRMEVVLATQNIFKLTFLNSTLLSYCMSLLVKHRHTEDELFLLMTYHMLFGRRLKACRRPLYQISINKKI